MVLLPEERGMTLAELRQIAARQQHQIEAQQQLMVTKEQRLKFLKQQEARHHHTLLSEQESGNCFVTLREKVQSQELKLRQLRALRGQVEQQKTNNSNLGTELDSIRALFCEKEKELDLAICKVDELSRQLDEIRKNSRKSYLITSTSELENLRRELTYRTKLLEQQNNYICQQREKISNKQQDIVVLDKRINELNERLHRKRILNEQFASQIQLSQLNKGSVLVKIKPRVPEILEPEHTQDDLAANLHGHHKCDFGEFSLTKSDPKYQTLPYNTKFTLKQEKQLEDSSSSDSTEDESSSASQFENTKKDLKPFANMCNFSPRPFNNAFSSSSGNPVTSQKTVSQAGNENILPSAGLREAERVIDRSPSLENVVEHKGSGQSVQKVPAHLESSKPASLPKSIKPAVPPKPALSVKPMLLRKKDEQDTVSMALTFLKSKSSEKEKNDFSNYRERLLYYQCVPRYPGIKESTQDPLLPKSRILTYFSKTLLQPEGSSQSEKSDASESISNKRKSSFGQLPIKPKPLTIRKTPGIEPPKLKVQSLTSSYRCKKSESVESLRVEIEETDLKKTQVIGEHETKGKEPPVPDVKQKEEAGSGGEEEEAENDPSEEEAEEEVDSGTNSDNKKGSNLKGGEASIRVLRRVSFDPLALLLDAALEGELELVKKIASEVVNPSAANDEGITALHNAICAGQFDVVKFLVEFGCDVNAPDSDGWTPLHCAASCNNLAMVKFLVERGACIFATTLSDQETAAEKCEEDGAGFDGCSEYLFGLQDNLGVMNNGTVYAVYDYDVQNSDELSFRNGDVLSVLRRSDDEENEWWWCRRHDQEGYVPRNLLGLYPRVTAPKLS